MNKDKLQRAIQEAKQGGLDDKTKDELYKIAQDQDIEGRSQMDKDELKKALNK